LVTLASGTSRTTNLTQYLRSMNGICLSMPRYFLSFCANFDL
jgi:phosphorylcholine metabolism protein LicD